MTLNAQQLKIFSHLTNFVSDLNEIFGKKQHSLELYNRLLNKTKISHKDSMLKHIEIFSDFVTTNNEAISDGDNSIWTQMTVKPYKFHFGGFLAGFFLGFIGVGFVYLLNKEPDARRSAWYGLGVWFISYLLLVALILSVLSNNDGNSYNYY